jgi:hypothetical protein
VVGRAGVPAWCPPVPYGHDHGTPSVTLIPDLRN